MYCWGRQLNFILAFSVGEVVEVTLCYTRQWANSEFQERRRQIAGPDSTSEQILAAANQTLRQGNFKARFQEVQRLEKDDLERCKLTAEWTEDEKHGKGRISGLLSRNPSPPQYVDG